MPAPSSRATQPATTAAPVIGISTYLEQARSGIWDVRAAFLPKVYLDSVTDAGGVAVLLPPQPVSDAIVDRVLDSIDGIIISGGADVDPALYGAEPHEKTQPPRRDRDAWEQALLRRAIARELPFLAICRGAQVLNVALGGTLHQHVPDLVGSDKYQPAHPEHVPVSIAVSAQSRLADILGGEAVDLSVPVYHHQAIDRLAEGLAVTALSDDGIIEAVELSTVPFGIAVQWHPEQDAADRRLFEALVAAAA